MTGRDELILRVQQAMGLETKTQAKRVVDTLIDSFEAVMMNHLDDDGFTLKLNSFGKLFVQHKPSRHKKVPFTGRITITQERHKVGFKVLGELRKAQAQDVKLTSSDVHGTADTYMA